MKPLIYKRVIAYVIDFIIVTFVATLLTYYLPETKQYEKSLDEYTSLISDITSEKVSNDEFVSRTNDVIYEINQHSITVTIVTTVLTIVYFVVVAYFMNGQTIGKKLMKLRIVSENKNKLTMNNYLMRGLIVNAILMNVLGIIFLLGFNKTIYLKLNDIMTYVFGIVYIITFGMILFRDDRRGLHDIIGNTQVVAVKDLQEDNNEEKAMIKNIDSKIKDAEIINEKKVKM